MNSKRVGMQPKYTPPQNLVSGVRRDNVLVVMVKDLPDEHSAAHTTAKNHLRVHILGPDFGQVKKQTKSIDYILLTTLHGRASSLRLDFFQKVLHGVLHHRLPPSGALGQ